MCLPFLNRRCRDAIILQHLFRGFLPTATIISSLRDPKTPPMSVPPAVAGGAFLRYPYTIAPPFPPPSRRDDRDWLLTLPTLFTFHSPLSILNSTRALHPRQTITHTQKPNSLPRDEHQPPVRTGSDSDWVPIPRRHSSQSSLAPRSSRINDRYCDVV